MATSVPALADTRATELSLNAFHFFMVFSLCSEDSAGDRVNPAYARVSLKGDEARP